MSEPGRFLIYCIEMYRRVKRISGRVAYDTFRATGVDDYVRQSYGALHTVGDQYIFADIDEYIQAHRAML